MFKNILILYIKYNIIIYILTFSNKYKKIDSLSSYDNSEI